MAYVVFELFLLGAVTASKAGLFGGRRSITPRAIPERPDRRVFIPLPDELADADDVAATPPAAALVSVGRTSYLLDGQRARAAPDRMTAVMDMMAGPGICTPPDG